MKESSQCCVAPKFLSGVIVLICAWYVMLCAVHFLSQRPLWLDEYNVFRSVKDFTPRQMFSERLMAGQIFPRLYLFLIQKISQPYDFSLQSLRLMSFLAMVSGFFVWLRIASHEFKEKIQLLTFTLSWASSVLLIYYSAELKPYAMDVLTGAVLLWFLYRQKDLQRKGQALYATLLFFLPFLVMLSYPAYLFLIFPLYNMIRSRAGKKFLAIYCFALLLAGATSYFFDIRPAGANAETQGFMDYTVSFASVGEFFKTAWEGTANLFFRWFAERPRIVKKITLSFTTFGLIFMFYGFFRAIKKDNFYFHSLVSVALILYGELFILGALHKYPFSVPRTSLFFCPFVLALTVKGISSLKEINRPLYTVVQGLYLCFLVVLTFSIAPIVFSGYLGATPQLWE